MPNKTTVAIYFTDFSLLVVEIKLSKRKVTRYCSIELPDGVIKDGRVSDVESLTKILKSCWAKYGFREKAVGLVVPEFSTFTKLLTLPKLAISDLDEAVRWQAQEFLPTSLEETVLDWKIIEKTEKNFEVLVVAVSKEILSSYVEASEKAGLFPMDVQIPSLSLVNLVRDFDRPLQIVYLAPKERILVTVNGNQILGTSVLKETDFPKTVESISKMINFFSSLNIENVVVGGENAEVFARELNSDLNKNVDLLKTDFTGIRDEDKNHYLIPLSMSISEFKEPSDPWTINLLPAFLVDKYRREKGRIAVWGLTLTMTLFVWVSFLVVLGSYLVIGQRIAELNSIVASKADTASLRQKFAAQAKDINTFIGKIDKIKTFQVAPQVVLNNIHRSKPTGVIIDSYQVDLDTGEIQLSGTSLDRASLISFREKLGKNDFSDIEIPISSFEKETNLEYQVSFKYLLGTMSPTPVVRK